MASYSKSKGRKDSNKSYVGIPLWVAELDEFINLSFSAKSLLFELAYQYRGYNNGDLTVAYNVLKKRAWKSRTTIERARDELIEADLIVCTRVGQFLNPGGLCSLYALRWRPINENPRKFDYDDIPKGKRQPRMPHKP